MTKELRDKAIVTGQVSLRPVETFFYYISVFCIGTINVLILYFAWNQTLTLDKPSPSTMTNGQLIFCTGISVIVMILIYYSLNRRLRLKKIETRLTKDQIRSIIDQVGQKIDLRLSEVYTDYFEADSISIMWNNNKVSLIIDDTNIYVNCRTTDGTVGGFSRQDKLMRNFIDALEKANEEKSYQIQNLDWQASR